MLPHFAPLRDILLSDPSYKVEYLIKLNKNLENELTRYLLKIYESEYVFIVVLVSMLQSCCIGCRISGLENYRSFLYFQDLRA